MVTGSPLDFDPADRFVNRSEGGGVRFRILVKIPVDFLGIRAFEPPVSALDKEVLPPLVGALTVVGRTFERFPHVDDSLQLRTVGRTGGQPFELVNDLLKRLSGIK